LPFRRSYYTLFTCVTTSNSFSGTTQATRRSSKRTSIRSGAASPSLRIRYRQITVPIAPAEMPNPCATGEPGLRRTFLFFAHKIEHPVAGSTVRMSLDWNAFLPALRLRSGEKAHLAVGSAITLANLAFAVELKGLTRRPQNYQTPLKAAALRLFAQSSRSLS
jgi:hypothetical protein